MYSLLFAISLLSRFLTQDYLQRQGTANIFWQSNPANTMQMLWTVKSLFRSLKEAYYEIDINSTMDIHEADRLRSYY